MFNNRKIKYLEGRIDYLEHRLSEVSNKYYDNNTLIFKLLNYLKLQYIHIPSNTIISKRK